MRVAFGCRPGLRLSAPEGAGLTAPAVNPRADQTRAWHPERGRAG